MISPAHRQAALKVAALLEQRLEAKATSPRPWTALETVFYGALARLLAGESDALAARIAADGPGAIDNPAFWTLHEAGMIDELAASLGQVARYGAQAAREALGGPTIGVNWGLVNRSAVDWAENHAAELVRSIEPVTRLELRKAVAEWQASGQPLGALADRIQGMSADGNVFSPARARRIAQTESTNAYAAGNALAWEAAGVQPAAYKPAAHVNCRCYLQPYRMPDGTMVMRWYTAADERVCVQPLQTPWGEVDGCRDLHGVIVSWGAYLGTRP